MVFLMKKIILTKVLYYKSIIMNSTQKVQLIEAIVELEYVNLGISIMTKWVITPF